MGAQLCFLAGADAPEPRESLRFHAEAKGAQVLLDATRSTARRLSTFHDGIVFSQRPVRRGERVALRVLGHEGGWCGGLRVGFTRLDPARVRAPSLPPFACPDLELRSPTWAAGLPAGAQAGDAVRFWVSRRGRLCARVNAGPRLRLRRGLPTRAPLWAVMDVYGTTTAIQLLDPEDSAFPAASPRTLPLEMPSSPQTLPLKMPSSPRTLPLEMPSDPEGRDCAVCLHRAADARLLPCGHAHFCGPCARRVFGDTARCPLCRWDIQAVVPARGAGPEN